MKQLLILLVIFSLGVGTGFFGSKALKYPSSEKTDSGTILPTKEAVPSIQENVEELISSWPKEGELVYSPLKVSGIAKGPWFWEGSFTVSVYDQSDKLLGTGIVQAQAESYTEGYVPFEGSVDFAVPSTMESGYVVYENGNASGLPENAKSIKILVRFN